MLYLYDEKKKAVSSYPGGQLYFCDFPGGKMISGKMDKEFTTVKYEFIQGGLIEISQLMYSQIKGDYSLKEGSEYHYLFHTVSNFNRFVGAYISNPALYAPKETFKKVASSAMIKSSLTKREKVYTPTVQSSEKRPVPDDMTTYSSVKSDISSNRERNLALTYKYSLLDVYQIQKSYPKSSCLNISVEAGGQYGETKTVYERKPLVVYDSQGNPQVTDDFPTKREVFISHGTSSQNVVKNTCSYAVNLKGIEKTEDYNGRVFYQDATYRILPDQTIKGNVYIVDDYDPKNSGNIVLYYKNDLKIDTDTYRSYLKEVLNNQRGSIIVNSSSSRSRIQLNKGDKITLKADGVVRVGIFAGVSGPDGIEGYDSYSTTKKAKHGSLIYKIGDEGEWRFAGENATIIAQSSGIFKLTVNDESVSDNTGQYIVDYEITRVKK